MFFTANNHMPWTSNTWQLFAPPLSAVFCQVVLSLHRLETTKVMLCLLVPFIVQHAKAWSIFNTLDTEAIGISFMGFSQLACFQRTFLWPSEDCNSQNICTYCRAQAMKRECLKTTHFPHRAGYSLSNATSICKDAGNQAAYSWAGSALRWTATQRDSAPDSYQVQLTDPSSWQYVEWIWKEWHNNNENKTTEKKKQKI